MPLEYFDLSRAFSSSFSLSHGDLQCPPRPPHRASLCPVHFAAVAVATAVVLSAVAARPAQAALAFGTTVEQDDIGTGTFLYTNSSNAFVFATSFVLAGEETGFGFGGVTTVSGKAIDPIAVNLADDTVLTYTLSAPAGRRFRVTLPDGYTGGFDAFLTFSDFEPPFSTTIPDENTFLTLDGVPQPLNFTSSSIDESGGYISLGASNVGVYGPGSFTFQTLSLTVDYSVDTVGGAIDIQDMARILNPSGSISFEADTQNLFSGSPTFIVEPVPEPASLSLLGVAGLGLLGRRGSRGR